MKTKPIIYATPMVRAIYENRKKQTRRKIKHKTKIENVEPVVRCFENEKDWGKFVLTDEFGEDFLIEPKFKVGDVMWVRETWTLNGWDSGEGYVNIEYKDGKVENFEPEVEGMGEWLENNIDKLLMKGLLKEDPEDEELLTFIDSKKTLWQPSIFMPKWACRLFLKCTGVRAEPLQKISPKDALMEGVVLDTNLPNLPAKMVNAVEKFKLFWQSIHGKESWEENPFVWVYDFEITERPLNFA